MRVQAIINPKNSTRTSQTMNIQMFVKSPRPTELSPLAGSPMKARRM